MNEKIVGWLAVGIIIGAASWVQKSSMLSIQQLQATVVLLLIVGICYRVVARRTARLVVLQRRRLFKDFWRREDQGKVPFDKPEEDLLALLGRIRGAMPTAAIMILGAIAALYFKANMLALVLALGNLYLAGQLHQISRSLDRKVPTDGDRAFFDERISPSPSDRYLVEIDLSSVHDFIRPRVALPFWRVAEAERWLVRCGLKRVGANRWEANKYSLCYLDSDELVSIDPIEN